MTNKREQLNAETWGSLTGANFAGDSSGKFSWFKQAKFGIFIHWGVYSLLEGNWNNVEFRGIAEWIMRVLEIPVAEYEKIARDFNPVEFDAEAWVSLFKEAGARYVTITSKHHDGFCLFDSAVDDFNCVKGSAYGRDIIKQISEACRQQDLRLCLYYSQDQDWHEPYGRGNNWDFDPDACDDAHRREYLHKKVLPNLEELLSNYGPVNYFWFDTPGYLQCDDIDKISATIARIQPECMASSRLGLDRGDFLSLPDQMVPTQMHYERCETAMTHNDSWAYSRYDTNWKSPETLIRQLVTTVSYGANYLLNVGPKHDGTIPHESVNALREIGTWLAVNGESIYETGPNPLGKALPWGVCTIKNNDLYLHVIEPPNDGKLLLPVTCDIESIRLLANQQDLNYYPNQEFTVIELPDVLPDSRVTVIKAAGVVFKPDELIIPENINYLLPNQTNIYMINRFTPVNGATISKVSWMHQTFGNWHHREIGCFNDGGSLELQVKIVESGLYQVSLEYDFPPAQAGNRNTLNNTPLPQPVTNATLSGLLEGGDQQLSLDFTCHNPSFFSTKKMGQN